MFHACVQRFDGMDEKILGGKLNRAFIITIYVSITLIRFIKNISNIFISK